jgi:hypothetical protein
MFSASLSWSHFEGVEDKKEAISEAWQKLAWPWCGCQSNDWYRNWRRYAPLTFIVLICFNLSLRMFVQFERTRIFVAMQSMSQHESVWWKWTLRCFEMWVKIYPSAVHASMLHATLKISQDLPCFPPRSQALAWYVSWSINGDASRRVHVSWCQAQRGGRSSAPSSTGCLSIWPLVSD